MALSGIYSFAPMPISSAFEALIADAVAESKRAAYMSWCRACGEPCSWDALEDGECPDCRMGDVE